MYRRLMTIAVLAGVVAAIFAAPAAAKRSCGTERVQPGTISPPKAGSVSGPGIPYEIIVWRGSVSCRKARSLIMATGEGKGTWHEARSIAGIYTSFPGGWSCALATGGDYGCWRGRRIGANGHADEIDGIQVQHAPKVLGAAFAGTWEQHESTLMIAKTGNGRMNYADLARCPSCSFGSAPRGTLNFVLTSVTKGRGTGHVTATSDSKLYTKGESVRVRLAAASPGEFLVLSIGRKLVTEFCNRTSAGQCGA